MNGARKAARVASDPFADMDVDFRDESQQDLDTPSGALLRIRLENFMCRACPHGSQTRAALPSVACIQRRARTPANASHVRG